MHERPFIVSISLFGVLLFGCGSDDAGTAPTIRDLTVAPSELIAGELQTLSGTVTFEDPDGDVLEFHATLGPEAGPASPISPVPISGTDGMTVGTVNVSLSAAVPSAGNYILSVWVRDAQGNDSNALTVSLIGT